MKKCPSNRVRCKERYVHCACELRFYDNACFVKWILAFLFWSGRFSFHSVSFSVSFSLSLYDEGWDGFRWKATFPTKPNNAGCIFFIRLLMNETSRRKRHTVLCIYHSDGMRYDENGCVHFLYPVFCLFFLNKLFFICVKKNRWNFENIWR